MDEADAPDPGTPVTLLKLVLALAMAGVVVAGLLVPWVGGPAVAAQQSTSLLGEPPRSLTDEPPAANSVMLAADGTAMTWLYEENRQPVAPGEIAEVVKQAIVAIEDARFHEHGGLDVEGTTRALVRNLAANRITEGGSTLTQQLVKQTLLQTATTPQAREAAVERSVGRKLREARLALDLEDRYSKEELLTRYLNIVYFGRNAYGIQPAARSFFGVDADELTLPQAALLAGLVQSPTDDDPFVAPEAAIARRNLVLSRMAAQGYITRAQATEAQGAPLGLAPAPAPPRGCGQARIGGYVCDFVLDHLDRLGLDEAEIEQGGYTIRTTLDVDLQRSGDAGVLATLPMGDRFAGVFSAVEPGTGHLLALSANRVFGVGGDDASRESVNLNVEPSRGAGSTYKVFVAAAALARGFGSGYTLTTTDPYVSSVYEADGLPYRVRNASRYRSTLDMTTALYQSSNTYFLALEDALGSVEQPVRMAEAMGLYQFGPEGLAERVVEEDRGSFTFGPDATSPLGLASAYSTLAAGGTQCDVLPVLEVLDRHGEPVLGEDGEPLTGRDGCTEDAVPRGVATTLNQMLRKDVEPGYAGQTGRRAHVPGVQIAGKTGTTQLNHSIAFVGYTPEIAASVMVFDPKVGQDVGGFGGGKAATIWRDAMAPVLTARGSSDFPPADPRVEAGDTVRVPWCRGARSCPDTLRAAGFVPETVVVDGDEPAGYLLGTVPPGGGRAVRGQVVTIRVSNGADYVAPEPTPTPTPTPTSTPTPTPTSTPTPTPTPSPSPSPTPDPAPAPEPAPEPGPEPEPQPAPPAEPEPLPAPGWVLASPRRDG